MLGWHVRSRPLALWCSQIVAPCVPAGMCAVQAAGTVVQSDCSAVHLCQQMCVQSRPPVL